MTSAAKTGGEDATTVGPPPTRFRELFVFFVKEDEALASSILRDLFPLAVYHSEPSLDKKGGPEPPVVEFHNSLDGCQEELTVNGWFPVAPVTPRWERRYRLWSFVSIPYPNMYMRRSPPRRDAANDIETLGRTDIVFRCHGDYPEQARQVEKAIRRIKRHCTRKVERVALPGFESHGPMVERNMYIWAGPNAVAWARENPRRAFLGGATYGYRPLD